MVFFMFNVAGFKVKHHVLSNRKDHWSQLSTTQNKTQLLNSTNKARQISYTG